MQRKYSTTICILIRSARRAVLLEMYVLYCIPLNTNTNLYEAKEVQRLQLFECGMMMGPHAPLANSLALDFCARIGDGSRCAFREQMARLSASSAAIDFSLRGAIELLNLSAKMSSSRGLLHWSGWLNWFSYVLPLIIVYIVLIIGDVYFVNLSLNQSVNTVQWFNNYSPINIWRLSTL